MDSQDKYGDNGSAASKENASDEHADSVLRSAGTAALSAN
jgi:hypothetical protein